MALFFNFFKNLIDEDIKGTVLIVVVSLIVALGGATIIWWLSGPPKFEKKFAQRPSVEQVNALYKQCKNEGGNTFIIENLKKRRMKGWSVICR